MFNETFRSVSFFNLSNRFRDVKYFPSWPEKGPSLTWKYIESVGSSIDMRGSGLGVSLSVSVSPILIPSMPAIAIISPDSNWSTLIFSNPLKV